MKYTVFVAGLISSGKSSVARAVADLLHAGYASFGDEVRDRAVKQGLDPTDRTELQGIGEDLVENHLSGFISAVLNRLTPRDESSRFIVLDGLRHTRIFEAINERLPERTPCVVYVDTPESVRRARAATEGMSMEASRRADAHSTESQSLNLRALANPCVPGDDDVSANAQQTAS